MGNWKTKKEESEYNHRYHLEHLAQEKERNKKWNENNRDRKKELDKKRYEENTEREKERVREYRRNNLEKAKAATRRWTENNMAKVLQLNAASRARQIGATPAWANKFFMEEAYDLAKRRSTMFRFKWHVDHIVPLKSKIVCGLHVENNLRVIPGVQNISKNNRYWPDMPGE